jgi:excisionase family DNA binding protein
MIDEAIRAAVAEAIAASEARIIAAVTAAIRQAQPARLLSVADAAAELGISQCSVRRHVADGTLPSRRVGARVLVDLSRPASDGDLFMQSDSPPGAARRGVDPDTGRATPQRRRGEPQS